MCWKYFATIALFSFFLNCNLQGQLKLYESTFNGGVVTGGYSNGATVPSGSGSFNVNIPAGSTIRRAYLIAGRVGAAPNLTITLNGAPYTFNASNIATTGFQTIYGGTSAVHAIDISAFISPATSAYTIDVPVQGNTVSDKYPEFYLYIAFNNPGLPVINSAIYLNTTDLTVSSFAWTLNTTQAVNNSVPVGLGLFGGYATTGSDCENVSVNGTPIGSFGGQDFNASSIWGCMAGFQYYNNSLVGYNDDNANQAMAVTDALSNIQALIPGSTNSVAVNFTHCGGGSDNHVWGLFLTWAGVILDGRTIDLQAEPQQDHVLLDWEMDDASGLATFDVQRSDNGQDFGTIGMVLANADGQSHDYVWRDEHPRTGSNWYRIRSVAEDGLASFSEIREVQFAGLHSIATGLSPNPMGQGARLQLQLLMAAPIDWTIYSLADSRELAHGHLDGNGATSLPTEDLRAGAYGIQLKSGSKMQMLRFVVK
jgi:hypothetical protein